MTVNKMKTLLATVCFVAFVSIGFSSCQRGTGCPGKITEQPATPLNMDLEMTKDVECLGDA